MDVKDIVSMIQVSGLATFLLLCLIRGLYLLGKIAIEKALVPVAQAHIAHVNTLTDTQQKLSDSVESLNGKIDKVCGFRHQSSENARHAP